MNKPSLPSLTPPSDDILAEAYYIPARFLEPLFLLSDCSESFLHETCSVYLLPQGRCSLLEDKLNKHFLSTYYVF